MVVGAIIWEAIDKDPLMPIKIEVDVPETTITESGSGHTVDASDNTFVPPPNRPVVEDPVPEVDESVIELPKVEIKSYWEYYERSAVKKNYSYHAQFWYNTITGEARDSVTVVIPESVLEVPFEDLDITLPAGKKQYKTRKRKFLSNFSLYVKYGRKWKDDTKYVGAGGGPEFFDRFSLMGGVDDRGYELFFQTKIW